MLNPAGFPELADWLHQRVSGHRLWILPCFTWESASLLNNIPWSLTWPWEKQGVGGRKIAILPPGYPAQRKLTDSSLGRSVFISLSNFPHIHAHLRRGEAGRRPSADCVESHCSGWWMAVFWRAAVPRWALQLRNCVQLRSVSLLFQKNIFLCVSQRPPFTPSLFIHPCL